MMKKIEFLKLAAPLGFYVVVPNADWVLKMAEAGADTIQLRNKSLSGEALIEEVKKSIKICQDFNVPLFINDYWQLAIQCGAYGVHLGQEDMDEADLSAIADAGLRLGLSTHSVEELDKALAVKPSYVASGAIFPTTTKIMPTQPQGLQKLKEYVAQAGDVPTVAIGGITLENACAVLNTGVSSLAVVRAVTESDDPQGVVKAFQKIMSEHASQQS